MINLDPARHTAFAGFVSRLIAFIVDVILILAIWTILRLTMHALLDFFNNILPFWKLSFDNPVAVVSAFLGTSLLQIGYFLFCWTVVGQTPGMALLGLEIIGKDARPPTLVWALVRYFGYWVCFATLGLGFLWILVDGRRQGWHDKLASTFIVYSATARLYHRRVEVAKKRAEALARQELSRSLRQ